MQQEKSCNCRNSKCMKLYCQCFAARQSCGKNCHCIDCHNTTAVKDNSMFVQAIADRQKKQPREQLLRTHRGCACRKSYCTKKYCECFQAGILCKDTCKCVDCQNNESLTNKKVIIQLKRNNSEANSQNSINLYPLYLSQNQDHLSSIISEANPLKINQSWLHDCANSLIQGAQNNSSSGIMQKFLGILMSLQKKIVDQSSYQNQKIKVQDQDGQGNNPQSNLMKYQIPDYQGNILIPRINPEVEKDSDPENIQDISQNNHQSVKEVQQKYGEIKEQQEDNN